MVTLPRHSAQIQHDDWTSDTLRTISKIPRRPQRTRARPPHIIPTPIPPSDLQTTDASDLQFDGGTAGAAEIASICSRSSWLIDRECL